MSEVIGRLRRRLRQVGPQPRPARGRAHRRVGHRPARRARPDPRDLPAARRAAGPAPRPRDRVVLQRRGPGRPRRAGPHRPGLDVRLQRRARAGRHPAVDRAARAPGADGLARRPAAGPHDAPRPRPLAAPARRPRRPRRARVGHHAPAPPTSWRCCGGGRRSTASCARCSTAATPCGPTTPTTPCGSAVSSPPTARLPCSPWSRRVTGRGVTPGTVPLPGLDPDRTLPGAGAPGGRPAGHRAGRTPGVVGRRRRRRNRRERSRTRVGSGSPCRCSRPAQGFLLHLETATD